MKTSESAHRRRVGAQRGEGRDVQRVVHHPELHARHVVRRLDLGIARGDGAKAALQHGQRADADLLAHVLEHLGADLAVRDRVGVLAVAEEEGRVVDVERRIEARHVGRRHQREVDDVDLHRLYEVARRADRAVGEDGDVDGAVGPLVDRVGEALRGAGQRVGLVVGVAELQGELGIVLRLGGAHRAAEHQRAGEGGRGPTQHAGDRDCVRHHRGPHLCFSLSGQMLVGTAREPETRTTARRRGSGRHASSGSPEWSVETSSSRSLGGTKTRCQVMRASR